MNCFVFWFRRLNVGICLVLLLNQGYGDTRTNGKLTFALLKTHVSYHIILSINMYNHDIQTSFVSPCLWHLGANKTSFNVIVDFYPRKAVYNTKR